MVLTERERYIAFGVGGLLGVVLLWFVIIGPYFNALKETNSNIDAAQLAEKQGIAALTQRNNLQKEWKVIQTSMSETSGDAKQEVRDELNQWATACGLNQKQLNDGMITQGKDFDLISFKLSGQGPQKAVAMYIFLCETTPRLLRINKITLAPTKEGQDDLNFDMTLSTICRHVDTGTKARVATVTVQRGNS